MREWTVQVYQASGLSWRAAVYSGDSVYFRFPVGVDTHRDINNSYVHKDRSGRRNP